ncbi:cold-shock DNA-binding protein family [Actinoalloteichus cyanogriseus DSM 43889]|uniref:Cold-shock DNA-binding protein family n=1 Tax=Actinoalloteichus caeruleus DSM 43889 TaxID=1120930 RepID=A0ABT1JB72_ACTCY|nr:cold-shock DNA-binding protein family [Actinoalloteichus caeruleus DSM 43889]
MVTTGKILRFDETRGYGFIAPDEGSEDVFMHANDLRDAKHLFQPGAKVSFVVEDGDRGLKASEVRLVSPAVSSPPAPARVAAPAPRPIGREDEEDGMCDVLSAAEFRVELTEALLDAAPTLTAAQVVQVRTRLLELARGHNWIES